MSYRSAVHETTNFTPAMLMFGRELRVPLDLLIGLPQEEPEYLCMYECMYVCMYGFIFHSHHISCLMVVYNSNE